ncbi:glycosyltransferase [Altericista sp. CCNU0014]|uniref:glycosyltransferase n=1 Tax=Altericista sp. CCNU0014 TaxID=3082949 RepID=UPI00384C0C3E
MEYPISVIICSHNPTPAYLHRVLDALKSQTLPMEQWELLLVDNASQESLAEIVDLSWHPHARHIFEAELGLVNARLRGLKEHQGKLCVFVDDDNVLDSDYLQIALEIWHALPAIGAWSGQIVPDFVGGTPEEWTRPMWNLLALDQFEKDVWSNIDMVETMPVGAGMCVRKEVGQQYVHLLETDRRRLLLGRRGKTGQILASNEDTDMALSALDIGLGMGKFTRLKLTHIIPASRLTEAYLLKILKGIVYSMRVMHYLRGCPR